MTFGAVCTPLCWPVPACAFLGSYLRQASAADGSSRHGLHWNSRCLPSSPVRSSRRHRSNLASQVVRIIPTRNQPSVSAPARVERLHSQLSASIDAHWDRQGGCNRNHAPSMSGGDLHCWSRNCACTPAQSCLRGKSGQPCCSALPLTKPILTASTLFSLSFCVLLSWLKCNRRSRCCKWHQHA